MRICFVLGRPELGGGVKVAFQLAQLAEGLGHKVEVYGEGPFPDWAKAYFGRDKYLDINNAAGSVRYDLVIATYYRTVPVAENLRTKHLVHFSQGYEGDLEHLSFDRKEIEKIYHRPYPIFCVNPVLARRLAKRFGKRWQFIPPPIDPVFRPVARLLPRKNPVLAVPGNFEVTCKGVNTCLSAVRRLRDLGMEVRLIRFSLLPESMAERSLALSEQFYQSLDPHEVARKLNKCDLLLQGSTPTEGFGLPAMEAALSGVPVVCTNLPATRLLGISDDYRVSVGDYVSMAESAHRLLTSSIHWNRARYRNWCRVRKRFAHAAVARRLDAALTWAVSM